MIEKGKDVDVQEKEEKPTGKKMQNA